MIQIQCLHTRSKLRGRMSLRVLWNYTTKKIADTARITLLLHILFTPCKTAYLRQRRKSLLDKEKSLRSCLSEEWFWIVFKIQHNTKQKPHFTITVQIICITCTEIYYFPWWTVFKSLKESYCHICIHAALKWWTIFKYRSLIVCWSFHFAVA